MGLELGQGGQRIMTALASVSLVVAALYFSREILIPLAMAILLTFLLSPLVTWLERRRLPRPAAVLLVMLAIVSGVSLAAWRVGAQIREMASELDTYKTNLKEKIATLHFDTTALKEVKKTIEEISGGEEPTNEGSQVKRPKTTADDVQTVRVMPNAPVSMDTLLLFATSVLTPLANAAIILVLVMFMLANREDMRNRIVRLTGTRLTLTTRTLDDIGTRISRYLLASVAINGGFGTAVALGLWLIGVDFPLMWGFLAAVLRYVPYAGSFIAAAMPITMAFIQFPGHDWYHVGLTAGLFVALELITYNIAEPLIYGHSAGVSTVALLVSVAFWTWVWGPMGLVLAVPLTVVMTVLGERVPALQPLGILLGDKPALDSYVTYYQRLLAHDVDEAAQIVDEQFQNGGLLELYDEVLVPALVLAERDYERGDLSTEARDFIWQATRELIDEMTPVAESSDADQNGAPGLRAHVLGCPAHDEADVLSLAMVNHLVPTTVGQLDIVSANLLAAEIIAQIGKHPPDAVCISSLGPLGMRPTRYLCKRLRQSYPHLPIVVGRWGFQGDRERMVQGLKRRGADYVVTTLAEARDLLIRLETRAQPHEVARS